MSVAEAFAESDAKYKAAVIHAAFGHLEPEPRRKYFGELLLADGDYTHGVVVIRSTFEIDAPFWYDQLHGFAAEQELEPGYVYRFTGWFMRFKNGGCRFSGKIEKVL